MNFCFAACLHVPCPTVAQVCNEDIPGVLATVQMHCLDKSPEHMGECVRELCETVTKSMVAEYNVGLVEGWFLCWEAMLELKGTLCV